MADDVRSKVADELEGYLYWKGDRACALFVADQILAIPEIDYLEPAPPKTRWQTIKEVAFWGAFGLLLGTPFWTQLVLD
jgi:hypothetical protein